MTIQSRSHPEVNSYTLDKVKYKETGWFLFLVEDPTPKRIYEAEIYSMAMLSYDKLLPPQQKQQQLSPF